jgi:hypothetical protein
VGSPINRDATKAQARTVPPPDHGAKREQRLLAGFARDETKLHRKTVRYDHLYIGRSKEGIQISITKDIAMPRTTTLPTIPLCGPSGNPASQRGA